MDFNPVSIVRPLVATFGLVWAPIGDCLIDPHATPPDAIGIREARFLFNLK